MKTELWGAGSWYNDKTGHGETDPEEKVPGSPLGPPWESPGVHMPDLGLVEAEMDGISRLCWGGCLSYSQKKHKNNKWRNFLKFISSMSEKDREGKRQTKTTPDRVLMPQFTPTLSQPQIASKSMSGILRKVSELEWGPSCVGLHTTAFDLWATTWAPKLQLWPKTCSNLPMTPTLYPQSTMQGDRFQDTRLLSPVTI